MHDQPRSHGCRIRGLLNVACLIGLSSPLQLPARPFKRDCATIINKKAAGALAQGCSAPHATAVNIHKANTFPSLTNVTGVAFLQSYLAVVAHSSTRSAELHLCLIIVGLSISIFILICCYAEVRAGTLYFDDEGGNKGVVGYRSAAKRAGSLTRREPSAQEASAQGASPSPVSFVGSKRVDRHQVPSLDSVNNGAGSNQIQVDNNLTNSSPFIPTAQIQTAPSYTNLPVPPQLPASQRIRFPPLCKDMILTNYGAWFAVDMHRLEEGASNFALFIHSGTPLLRVSVQTDETREASKISIFMKGAKSPALGSIVCPPSASRSGSLKMDILDKGGAFYGDLRSTGPMTFAVSVASQEVMQINFDASALQLLACSSQDGAILAHAAKCMQNDNFHDEHLEVSVNPGVDAVLVVLCILGIIIIAPSKGHEFPGTLSPHSDAMSHH